MPNKFKWPALILLITVTPAGAQGLETLGARAAGMSAFVAVADDVSAVAWNPAGLVLGPFFNASFDLGRTQTVPEDTPTFPLQARKLTTTLIAVGVPPLGLSYYRIGTIVLDAVGPEVADRLRREDKHVIGRSLVTTHLGATLLHSLGDYVTVGTTLKLVHGRLGSDVLPVESWNEGFDRAETLHTFGSTTGDLDLGAMFGVSRIRAGLIVRNVTEPTFRAEDDPGPEMTLKRHVRAGIAWGDRWPGMARTVVAIDADLSRVPHATGDRRDIAGGVERWLRGPRIGVRGGLRASTFGRARPVATGGFSYAVRAGTFVEAYIARGRANDQAWGISARLSY